MAKLVKKENNTVEFSFEIEAADFSDAMQKAYKKVVQEINIPGFRKGKAPRKLIEQQYGEAVFYDEALNISLQGAYEKAVEELDLDVINRPNIEDIGEIKKGENVVVNAKVEVKPEVKLGEYKGIKIEKSEYTVNDEDIDKEIAKLQDRNSRLITVDDRPVADGDTAIIDFEGFKDGVAFDGGKGEGHSLVIGSGSFIPGFEEQLIGKNVGEDVEVNVTFPEDYHAEDLKGAAVVFNVKIQELKFKELPELNDDFAKDVSEFDTMDDLKNDYRAKLEKDAAEKEKAEIENKAIEEVAKNAEIQVPQVMIDSQIDVFVQDYSMRMQQQGMEINKYLELTGLTMDDFKKNFAEQAENQVRATLTLEAIAKAENFEITEEELETQYNEMAENYKMEVAMVKMYVPADNLTKDLLAKKAADFVVDNAKF